MVPSAKPRGIPVSGSRLSDTASVSSEASASVPDSSAASGTSVSWASTVSSAASAAVSPDVDAAASGAAVLPQPAKIVRSINITKKIENVFFMSGPPVRVFGASHPNFIRTDPLLSSRLYPPRAGPDNDTFCISISFCICGLVKIVSCKSAAGRNCCHSRIYADFRQCLAWEKRMCHTESSVGGGLWGNVKGIENPGISPGCARRC